MRQCRALIAALPVLVLLAAPTSARAANVNVNVGGSGFIYNPSTVTLQVGDTVTWINAGGSHNVVSDSGAFRCANGCDGLGGNGNVSSSAWRATFQFNTAGTFGYHCTQHGSPGSGMHGTIIVQGGSVPPAPTALTAAAASKSEIALSWHNVTGETGYLIERRKLGAAAFQEIGSVTSNVTIFVAGGLEEATAYTFRVRAQNGAGNSPFSNEATAATDALVAPCVASSTVLCLTNNRFAVRLAWRSPAKSGDGQTVPLPASPDSGLFYFEQSSNIEMLIKVLNACSFTPNYWVFFAATTNVELVVTVIDTQTGKTRVYFNPLGTAALPVQDTGAFNCP